MKTKLNKLVLFGIGICIVLFLSVATAVNNGNYDKNIFNEIFVDRLTANNNTEIEINSSLIWTNNAGYNYYNSNKKDYTHYTSGNLKTHVENPQNSGMYSDITQQINSWLFRMNNGISENMFELQDKGFKNYYHDSANNNYNYLGLYYDDFFLEVGDRNNWSLFETRPDNFYFYLSANNRADERTFGMNINGVYTDGNITLNGNNRVIDLKDNTNTIKLYSPNSTCYKLAVDDNGVLSTTAC